FLRCMNGQRPDARVRGRACNVRRRAYHPHRRRTRSVEILLPAVVPHGALVSRRVGLHLEESLASIEDDVIAAQNAADAYDIDCSFKGEVGLPRAWKQGSAV